jgi:hypothetical protein
VEDRVEAGGRVGFYFDRLPWLGFALNGSWFRPEEDFGNGVKFDVAPISLLVLARIPLAVCPAFPHGRFHPYLGVGPSAVYSRFKQDLAHLGLPGKLTDDRFDVGLDARGGLTWMLTRTIGLFGEYRFTYVKPECETTLLGLSTTTEIELAVHHVAAGVTLRF